MLEDLKEEQFCQYYCGDAEGNATRAAKMAGYDCANLGTLYSRASRLASNARIRQRIREIQRERLSEIGFSSDEAKRALVKRLWNMINTPYSDLIHISNKDDPNRGSALSAAADGQDGQQPLDFGQSMVVPACKMDYADDAIREATKSVRAKRDSKGNLLDFDVDGYDIVPAMRLFCELTGLLDKNVSVETGGGGLRIILDTPVAESVNG